MAKKPIRRWFGIYQGVDGVERLSLGSSPTKSDAILCFSHAVRVEQYELVPVPVAPKKRKAK